ncbi:MAG TPA: chemotaxis protein CheX [Bryobacteraceae bacterium]|nr:chemotaxis protein CheX [Bryobacteraceae bacterium]
MSENVRPVHSEDLESVVASVFSTMMGLEVHPSTEQCPGLAGVLTSSVYLTGEWNGAVAVHVAPPQACAFAGRFLGIPAEEAVTNDVRDVMGELANMIAGNLKCTLAPGIRVSIPSVTDGAEYSLRVCHARTLCRVCFRGEGGPCWVTLLEAEEAT